MVIIGGGFRMQFNLIHSFTDTLRRAANHTAHAELEVRLDEFDRASELLLELQSPRLHSRCPGTRNPPTRCAACEEMTGDEYAVWRLLMIVNQEW